MNFQYHCILFLLCVANGYSQTALDYSEKAAFSTNFISAITVTVDNTQVISAVSFYNIPNTKKAACVNVLISREKRIDAFYISSNVVYEVFSVLKTASEAERDIDFGKHKDVFDVSMTVKSRKSNTWKDEVVLFSVNRAEYEAIVDKISRQLCLSGRHYSDNYINEYNIKTKYFGRNLPDPDS